MIWVPKKGSLRRESNYGSAAVNAPGTQLSTDAGSASTKGAVAQLIASTGFDAYLVEVVIWGSGISATNSRAMVDILIGAATEEVLIPDLLSGYTGETIAAGPGPNSYRFPLYVPAGSRLSARIAGERLGNNATCVGISLYGGDGYPPWHPCQKVTTYGIGTRPAATAVAAGVSGANGNFVQIAQTTKDHGYFLPGLQCGGGDTTLTVKSFNLGLGVSETAADGANAQYLGGGLAQGWCYKLDATEHLEGPFPKLGVFQDVPSGHYLYARLSSSGANDTNSAQVAVYAC
jgi:hypothetical protein